MKLLVVLLGAIAAAAALPTDAADPVISRLGGGQRYMPMRGGDGVVQMVDTWLKASDVREAARFIPDTHNVYHLFTRQNPTLSQPLLLGSSGLLGSTNYNPNRRTIFILHGWTDSVLGNVNSVLIPGSEQHGLLGSSGLLSSTSYNPNRRTIFILHGWTDSVLGNVNSMLIPFLAAEDVNVISVDWSVGAGTINYIAAVANTLTSGESVARFINWLMSTTGTTPGQIHIVGHSLGGHQSGIIGRNVNGNIAYITALDPAFPGWITNDNKFRPDDGAYTEVIHTNVGLLGYIAPLGHVDFYPNGGVNMPGCDNMSCDHDRCYYYLAESLLSGGFTGTRCATYGGAMTGNCILWGSLKMGGLTPKTGNSGIYYLETNAAPPFSRG